jgi:lipoprotein-anchoring transpeptidase ErfK/SrfK
MRPTRDTPLRRRGALAAALLAGILTLTSACTGSNDSPSWQGNHQPGQTAEPAAKAAATITSPAADAKDVPASADIVFDTKDAVKTSVTLKDAAGEAIAGDLETGGKSWLPAAALEYATTYTATVTVTGDDNKTASASRTFTTMGQPANTVAVSSFLGDKAVVGVGMPMIVKFGRAIPQDKRADVQKRMTVTTTPVQDGIWRWISPTEVHYRPKTFWRAGTKISYKLQTGGLPMGDGWYGRNDLTVDVSAGPSLVMTVDNRTKTMTVTRNGKVIKTILVSLGKASTPSSSGAMLVIEKKRHTVFDTLAELGPQEGYRTDIDYAQRITWGGEFIHAAPWSEGQQGRVNVSHGCVNVSMKDGAWLFGQTRIGDPVTVKGTERRLQNGNGWTDWNMSFEEYAKGSALPFQSASATPSAAPGA